MIINSCCIRFWLWEMMMNNTSDVGGLTIPCLLPRHMRVRLSGSWFMIYNEVLNFYDWILCYHELFHDKVKTHSNISMDLWFISVIFRSYDIYHIQVNMLIYNTLNTELCSFCSFILSYFLCCLWLSSL